MMITGAQWFDWMVSLGNFTILFVLFRLVVILPMEQAVRLREQRVRLRLKEIEDVAAEAKAKQESFEAKFGDVESVLAEIKASSDRSVAQAKVKIDEKAELEERYVLQKATVESESLRREVQSEIRSRIASMAVARAESFLRTSLDASVQNAIVTAGVKKVGELSAS